jgi:hypothetical protein
MTKHDFHPSILRAYDIRGIIDETLNLHDAKAIGIAFAACLRQRGYGNHVAVGRDGRLSSQALAPSAQMAPTFKMVAAKARCRYLTIISTALPPMPKPAISPSFGIVAMAHQDQRRLQQHKK